MVAELVEAVHVEPVDKRVERGAHLLGEDVVAKSLRGKDFGVFVGYEK